jgi:hypothetical protein
MIWTEQRKLDAVRQYNRKKSKEDGLHKDSNLRKRCSEYNTEKEEVMMPRTWKNNQALGNFIEFHRLLLFTDQLESASLLCLLQKKVKNNFNFTQVGFPAD